LAQVTAWAGLRSAAQLLTGFLGAPPLRYTKADAKQLGVTAEYVNTFLDWPVNVEKMRQIPHTCTCGRACHSLHHCQEDY